MNVSPYFDLVNDLNVSAPSFADDILTLTIYKFGQNPQINIYPQIQIVIRKIVSLRIVLSLYGLRFLQHGQYVATQFWCQLTYKKRKKKTYWSSVSVPRMFMTLSNTCLWPLVVSRGNLYRFERGHKMHEKIVQRLPHTKKNNNKKNTHIQPH